MTMKQFRNVETVAGQYTTTSMETKKPDWETLNFDNIMDWCEELAHYLFVEEELSDIGIHCKEIEDRINTGLLMLKKELDKMEFEEDD